MSKLPNVGVTIFTTMSKLATEVGAINLSQGFPDFPVDEDLIATYHHQIDQNVHQYAPMPGSNSLLHQLGALIEQNYNRSINPEQELLVTAGATQGIFTTILGLVQAGEEVIILDPSYDCYEPAVILAGGTPIRINLNDEFLPDWEKIEASVNGKTKLIIINNPHNPSGRVWSEDDMKSLEHLLLKHENILVLSDEVYEFIHFEKQHKSVNSIKSIRDRAIIISSFGKTFHVTGWKIGYLVAAPELMSEIKKIHQFNVFSVNSVAQATLAEYLSKTDVSTLGKFYQEKRDLFQRLMVNSKFKLLPCEGTYFQTAEYSAISELYDLEFCKELAIKHGVAAIPISAFNADGHDQKIIRFCFAKNDTTLIEATSKLCKI